MANNKTKASSIKHFILAILVMVLLGSMAYCAFVTVVLADGKQNLYLAAPTVLAIFGTILVAVYKAASTFTK
jgi:hypothetical protein